MTDSPQASGSLRTLNRYRKRNQLASGRNMTVMSAKHDSKAAIKGNVVF